MTAGRTNLKSLLPQVVWCYMLDSSHPTIAASAPPCESSYYTDETVAGGVKFCWLDGSHSPPRCKATSSWIYCDNAPPTIPSPLAPPLPPLPLLPRSEEEGSRLIHESGAEDRV